jgi:hypothetical protein
MEDLRISLLVIVFTGVLVGVIFYLVNLKKNTTEKAIRDLAAQKGWEYMPFKETLSWGYHLKSPQWILESVTETTGNSAELNQNNAAQYTRLTTSFLHIPGHLLINPHAAGSRPLNAMQLDLAQRAASFFSSGVIDNLEEIHSGSSNLREHYSILGQPDCDTSSLFSPLVENSLLNWKGERPWIRIGKDGMQIEIRNKNIQKPEEIGELVNLADSLIASSKKIKQNK